MREMILTWLATVVMLAATAVSCHGTCENPVLPSVRAENVSAEALCVARLIVHEAGWSAQDGAAIVQTLRNLQRDGETLCDTGNRHARGRLRRHDTVRSWTLRLPALPSASPPHGWTYARAQWPASQRRWQRVLAKVHGEWIEETPRACHGHPLTWGGRCDRPTRACDLEALERRNRARVAQGMRPLRLLACGDTANGFWGI